MSSSAAFLLPTRDLISLEQGGPEWQAVREGIDRSFYFFHRYVFSMVPEAEDVLKYPLHGALCLTLEECYYGRIKQLFVSMSRKHVKSGIVTSSFPAWVLAKRVLAGLDPNDRFGIGSYSKPTAEGFWKDLKTGFESNELFQWAMPELIPDFRLVKHWNDEEGTVPRAWDPREPSFDCFAKGTGRAYDWVIQDDLINEENFDSPTAIEKAIELFKLSQNLIDHRVTGRAGVHIVVGNPWSLQDVAAEIIRKQPGYAVFMAGCYGPRLAERAGQNDPYVCRGLPKRVTDLLAELPENEPIWPEKYSREKLQGILTTQGVRIFSAQWLCNPTDPEMLDFNPDWVKEADVVQTSEGPGIVYADDPEGTQPTLFKDCNIALCWDPALDGKYSKSRNAMLVVSLDAKGRYCVLKEYARKEDPLKSIENMIALAATYRSWLSAIGVEKVVFSEVLRKLVDEQRKKVLKMSLPVKPLKVPTKMTKEQRNRAWIGTIFEDGLGYVRRGNFKFIEEYGHAGLAGATNDLIDCFAHSTRVLSKPRTNKQREASSYQAMAMATQLGITGYGDNLA